MKIHKCNEQIDALIYPINGKDLFNQPEGFYETNETKKGSYLLLVKYSGSLIQRSVLLRIDSYGLHVAFTDVSQLKSDWWYRAVEHKLCLEVK